MVLDHDDGVTLVDERMQHADQFLAVAEVQSDRRLLEQVEIARLFAAAAFAIGGEARGKLGHELEPLRFAAGQASGELWPSVR